MVSIVLRLIKLPWNAKGLDEILRDFVALCLCIFRSAVEEVINHCRVGHGGDVAQVTVTHGDLSQYSSHDLPGACLGKTGRFLDEIRRGKWPDSLTYCQITREEAHLKYVEEELR